MSDKGIVIEDLLLTPEMKPWSEKVNR